MFTILDSVWRGLRPTKPESKPVPPRARLKLEPLEDRLLLATYLWVGPANGTWGPGDANNFKNVDNGNNGVPTTGDSVWFNPLLAVGGTQGTNTSSTYDRGALSLVDLKFWSGYTGELSLNNASDIITVTGTASMANGAVAGFGEVHLANNTSFSWTEGRISNTWKLGSSTATSVTTTISGTGAKKVGGFLYNYGTATWAADAGDIEFIGNVPTLANYGTFDIRTDADLTGANGLVSNYGVFKKSLGSDKTTVAAEFANLGDGQLLLNSGVVKFTNTAEQYTAGEGAPLTQLNGGGLETTTTYYVGGGVLEGVGTITGNLATGTSSHPTAMGKIRPGLSGAPGTLNVVGNFTMNAASSLIIAINAQGTPARLNVQKNAQDQGGTATLAGTLVVNRDPLYTPPPTDQTHPALQIMEYAAVSGNFSTFNLGGSWMSGQQGPFAFVPDKKSTTYELKVEGSGGPGPGQG